MSHKDKVCETALATHIETCFDGYTYAPLVINGPRLEGGRAGLSSTIEHEFETDFRPKLDELVLREDEIEEIAEKFVRSGEDALMDTGPGLSSMSKNIRNTLTEQVATQLRAERATALEEAQAELIAEAGPAFDITKPQRALEARAEKAFPEKAMIEAIEAQFQEIKIPLSYELEQLGMFFTEATCFRPEGLAYSPCGKEYTLLPGESISEVFSSEEELSSSTNQSETAVSNQSQSSEQTGSETLSNSYERQVKRTIDLKYSVEGSASGKFFGLLNVSMDTNASANFNHVLTQTSKSSREQKRSFINEIVNSLKTTRSRSVETSSRTLEKSKRERNISNNTDKPIHFIERQPYCVNSVIHKRVNAQLAWCGCIDDPARDICDVDDLETTHSADIGKIREKWAVAAAPAEFGTRPGNETRFTEIFSTSGNGFPFGLGKVKFDEQLQASVPGGYSYIGNSADIEIVSSSSAVQSQDVTSQPAGGSTGTASFAVKIMVDNRPLHREKVSCRIRYEVASAAAAEWDSRVDLWRQEQADAEIEAFLAAKEAELNEFTFAERFSAAIQKRIFEDYFGLIEIEDCCDLIRHIQSIFDFSNLCYKFLPPWNALGTGCESSNPVELPRAACVNFYVPVFPGKEYDALAVLLGINVIPNNPSVVSQISGYINQIINLRNTLFNSEFDPSAGWNEIVDAPNKYKLTPHDTNDPDWDTNFETMMNYQLIDVHTVTIPVGGPRTEIRPNIC